MGKKSQPSAPDPAATAAAQGAANKEAVQESAKDTQINQVSPYGSLTYTGEVGSPDRTATTTLSPEQQKIYDQQNSVATGLGDVAKGLVGQVPTSPLNFDNIPGIPQNYDQLRTDSSNRVYNDLTQNMQRDYDRSEETLRSKLAAQGLSANDEAYKREIQNFQENKNTAQNNAAATAYQYGQGEANNAYNQASQTRNQDISETLQLRDQPINELSAIIQGTPALQSTNPNSSLVNTGQYTQSPVNVAGINDAAYQNQLSASGQRASKLGGTAGNLAGLAGAAIMHSAAEIKDNKEPLSEAILDKLVRLPIETWNYKPFIADTIPGDNGEKHIGCYAGDFKEIFGIGDGQVLNVIDLFGVVMQSIKELAIKVEKLECKNS